MKKTIKQPTEQPKARRGFAAMDKQKGIAIARLGGLAMSRKPGAMRKLGRKGGLASGAAKRKASAK